MNTHPRAQALRSLGKTRKELLPSVNSVKKPGLGTFRITPSDWPPTKHSCSVTAKWQRAFRIPHSFLGRLATYRYMDMEAVIGEALELADSFVNAWEQGSPLPIFPNLEE